MPAHDLDLKIKDAWKPPAAFTARFGVASSSKTPSGILRKADEAPTYGTDVVTFVVGPPHAQTSFAVHETLVRGESAFVNATLSDRWKEGALRTISLPEHDADHFRIFFHFVYSRRISSGKSDDVTKGDAAKHKLYEDREWERLAHSYALANYLIANDFKDALTDAIIQKVLDRNSDVEVQQTMHQVIYPHSGNGSPIRRLLIRIARLWPASYLAMQRKTGSSDFLFDLLVALHSTQGPAVSIVHFKAEECIYHEHPIGMTCYKDQVRF